MIALLVIVVSAAVFVAAVTKILDVQLRQAEGPSHPTPATEPRVDEPGAEGAAVEEHAVAEESPAVAIDLRSPISAEATVPGRLPGDDHEDVSRSQDDRTRSRLGASSRLLVTLIVMGAVVSLAIVLLVGWLGRMIAAALS